MDVLLLIKKTGAPRKLSDAEERFGVVFSDRGMRNLLGRVGLSCTRPTYTLEKANPENRSSSGRLLQSFLKENRERP